MSKQPETKSPSAEFKESFAELLSVLHILPSNKLSCAEKFKNDLKKNIPEYYAKVLPYLTHDFDSRQIIQNIKIKLINQTQKQYAMNKKEPTPPSSEPLDLQYAFESVRSIEGYIFNEICVLYQIWNFMEGRRGFEKIISESIIGCSKQYHGVKERLQEKNLPQVSVLIEMKNIPQIMEEYELRIKELTSIPLSKTPAIGHEVIPLSETAAPIVPRAVDINILVENIVDQLIGNTIIVYDKEKKIRDFNKVQALNKFSQLIQSIPYSTIIECDDKNGVKVFYAAISKTKSEENQKQNQKQNQKKKPLSAGEKNSTIEEDGKIINHLIMQVNNYIKGNKSESSFCDLVNYMIYIKSNFFASFVKFAASDLLANLTPKDQNTMQLIYQYLDPKDTFREEAIKQYLNSEKLGFLYSYRNQLIDTDFILQGLGMTELPQVELIANTNSPHVESQILSQLIKDHGQISEIFIGIANNTMEQDVSSCQYCSALILAIEHLYGIKIHVSQMNITGEPANKTYPQIQENIELQKEFVIKLLQSLIIENKITHDLKNELETLQSQLELEILQKKDELELLQAGSLEISQKKDELELLQAGSLEILQKESELEILQKENELEILQKKIELEILQTKSKLEILQNHKKVSQSKIYPEEEKKISDIIICESKLGNLGAGSREGLILHLLQSLRDNCQINELMKTILEIQGQQYDLKIPINLEHLGCVQDIEPVEEAGQVLNINPSLLEG